MRVNGENLITVEYDRDTMTQAIFMEDRAELLNITYDDMSRPVAWTPRTSFNPVQLSYDRFGQLALWKQVSTHFFCFLVIHIFVKILLLEVEFSFLFYKAG